MCIKAPLGKPKFNPKPVSPEKVMNKLYTPQEFFEILAFGIPAMDCSNNTRETVKAGLRFMAENFAQIAVAYNNQLKEKSNG